MKDVLINFPQLDCCKNLADKLKQNNLNCKLDSYNVQDDVVFEKLQKSICIGNEYQQYPLNSMVKVVLADVISCLTFPYHLKKLRSILIFSLISPQNNFSRQCRKNYFFERRL